ncbi:MAG TPA: dockerin type I domain-containing protein [Planctomycetota bacterium]|jgi:ferric-dicitrate binding protein FerR (iron transport regulator)|nr:dockerin type I domain-containing protein [Planctomycetota bacterium]
MDGHPDLLALDALRAGEGSAEERAHASQCPECRATLEGFRRLAAGLAPAPLGVPESVKQQILARTRPSPRRRSWRPLAAAAAVLIGLGAVWVARSARPSLPGDVDRNGRVDIVDAYALAVRLRSGEKMDLIYDVNGDGRVDERDVEEIARRSVSLR